MFFDVYKRLCLEKGKTPSAVANELHINRSNVTNWKSRGYMPRGDALDKIADFFGVSVDYIVFQSKFSFVEDWSSDMQEDFSNAKNDEERLAMLRNFGVDPAHLSILDRLSPQKEKPLAGTTEILPSDIRTAKIVLFGGDSEVTNEMWAEALLSAEIIKEKHRRAKEKND